MLDWGGTESLRYVSIVDLIQYVSISEATGELYLYHYPKRSSALAYFEQGELIHAITTDMEGLEALGEILCWTSGSFRFKPNVISSHASIQIPLDQAITDTRTYQTVAIADGKAETRLQTHHLVVGAGYRF